MNSRGPAGTVFNRKTRSDWKLWDTFGFSHLKKRKTTHAVPFQMPLFRRLSLKISARAPAQSGK